MQNDDAELEVSLLTTHPDGAVQDALRNRHPETWKAVLARAAKQVNTFPIGMSNAADPAYGYLPPEA